MSAGTGAPHGSAISYEQWGVDFFREAISPERVCEAVNTIAGHSLAIGPVGVGPGGIAKMSAQGRIGEAVAVRQGENPVSFQARVPVQLTFEVDLRPEKQHFDADLVVCLTLTAIARTGLRIFIEVTPPAVHEVEVELVAHGKRASLLQRVAGVEDELRQFVADYVSDELDRPVVRRTRSIEVSRVIPDVWDAIGPDPDPGADGPTSAGAAR